MNAENSLIL